MKNNTKHIIPLTVIRNANQKLIENGVPCTGVSGVFSISVQANGNVYEKEISRDDVKKAYAKSLKEYAAEL